MTSADESPPAAPRLPFPLDHAAVFDAIPLPATLIDRQWIIRDVNQAFLESAWSIGRQIGKADRVGRPILEFAGSGDEGRQLAALIARLWATGERQVLQLTYTGARGGREHMVIRAELVRDGTGAVAGALLLREKVTEQVEDHLGLERELVRRRQLEQELIRLERLGALSELSAGISHNLNNLLTGILVPAQMLRLEIQDQDQAEALDTIVVSARRASDLVQRLHRWSRRQEEAGVGAVSLNATVAEVVRASEPIWKDEPEARGVAIHVEQRLQEVRPVRGTIAGMHDILTNLLLNAVAALPRGGTITIATRPAGDAVELVFADDGVGMDEETRLRVFEPFFTTRKDVGSGLGLATVYGMVQRWGGQIQVASAPGQGATFVLRLPTAENEPPGRRDLEDAPDSGSRGRLLVVEDEAAVARTMELLLGGRHEVDVARSAKEGLERARANGYDVALIDLGLPDRSGDQLALELRQLDPGLVLVLVTGWLLDEEDPRRAPFDYVLQKPFTDLTEVLDIVAQSGRREDR